MINNVSVIEHDKLILYSLDDFAMDEDLQECIRNAKVEAISLKNASCQVKEIGNGSANNTSVFCIPNPDISGEKLALKLVSYITTTYPPEYEADEAVRDLVNNTPKSNRVIDEIINSLKTKDCRNVIPLSGHDTIIWKCPKYNRIGIDYALKMPLAACINDTISKYVVRHNTGTNALLTEEKPETEKTILEIGIDLCIALQDLHAHGIIHRDIKPGNIFLYKEHYCLGDFGIAVENPSSQDFRVGTQDYWAPEQAGDMFSDKYDHRMDIYSLGLVLYELADTMSVSMHYRDRMKGQSLPDLSSVSKGLNKILHKACQFDPDNRYQNAEAFWADLHLLQNKHDYIPVYQAPEESHEYATSKNKSAGTPSNTAYSSSQKRNPYGRKQARKKLEDFIISPETVWNAGKFWYDESCKRGNRFSGFDIDRRIMPLSVTSNHVIDLPVNVVTDQETVKNQKPLSEIISNIEKLHNMYLIGEGGIGKTTALYSIMKDAYREKLPSKSENEKQIIPLFIELSKAPAEYCSVYESSHSTFIRRYLFMLINSFHSQHLISESAVEMTRIMQMDMIFSVQKIDALLRKSPNNVQYLLLLDGLNEVARKQLSIPGNDYMGSPLEFIVSEIHELLKHSNVSVIITSRADETLGDSKNIFDGLFSLIGKLPRADRCTYTDGIPRFGSYMFSPDSRYFIFKPFALSSRCHIELWSTDTCKFIKKIVGYDYSNHVAFSPDEKYILTIDSLCQLKLFAFDKVTGSTSLIHDTEIKHILNYEIPTMTCIQFVCNGKYVLMGDNYGNLFLCDFETILTSPKNIEKHCWILSGHHDSINSISEYIYNDAHYAITSSSDCKVKIWNLQTKKCISLLHKGNISSTLSACYILNGKYIVVSGNSRELLIFDPLTGKYVDRIGTTDNYTWKYTWKVSYHAETKQLAVVLDNGSVALYRYQNNTFVHQKTVKMMDEYIGELKFSPKGDKLLTISYIGNILCIYNILSEKLITLDKVNSIHKSDAFAYLDTDTSGTPPNYDDTVVEVTTAPGKAVQTSRNYTFRGNGTFSYPDGDTVLASFQNADSIGYFDSATGKFKGINHAYYEPYRKNIMHKLYKKSQDFPWSIGMRQVDSIAYNRDGTYLFITRHGGRVEIWSTFTGKCLAILKAFNADAKKLAVSDDGDYIAFSTCGPNIKIYRMCDIHTTDSFDLCYSDNITDWKCKYNIRGEWRFQVRKSANKLYHFIYKTQEGHKQPIAGMEFSPDKKQLLTTAYDRSVKIWDLSDASRDQYNISPHCLYSIEFIPGLKVKGAVIQNLHSSSNLTDKELESLKTYGAIL